ncbi:LuxE/PaaK family acyltransferase [Mycobacterium szulgai]|uniref:Acyl-protein synthetase LuxE domain-containing protein n=1 Tax=Mycobacterium szulgai TaxID=1787 RepID=A0A1X2FCP7_MYCSZ|nr:hypothetical protein [Mycobacterium szulgai]MCV7075401.1 acyl-CoA reductase [Mycobacterium szulgai]ORX16222.1 hypothetical protein AWC27_01120 [Mycobacterium szulgai]
MYPYHGRFVAQLVDDIACLILGEDIEVASILDRSCALAVANSPLIAEYWRSTGFGHPIPDTAFKQSAPYLFPDQPPVRHFHTSGTSGAARGRVGYSACGMELMRMSILDNARRHVMAGLSQPAIIRFVPPAASAPAMVMAYGMELIATELGDPELSEVVVGAHGVDYERLETVIERVCDAGQPAVLIGGSSVFANVCEHFATRAKTFALPAGSRVVDAGGFKRQSAPLHVDALRASLTEVFGIPAGRFMNLFGMTELASQLYDRGDASIGPLGERIKGGQPYVQLRVRDAETMNPVDDGLGLLEVIDLCVLDRPPALLTGDLAVAAPDGAAIVGRVQRNSTRGCSVSLDALTAREAAHV